MKLTRPLLAALLTIMTISLAGCLFKNPSTNATTNSASGSTNSGTSAATTSDDASVVRNAFAQLKNRSFRMREESNMGASGQIVTRTVEFVPPDRRHAVLGELETITIGNQRYTKSNGSWTKADSTARVDTGEILREAFHKAVVDGSLKVEHTGTDTVDGQAADIFTITGTVPFNGTTIKGYTMKVWVTKDGLLRKVESTNEANKQWKSVVTYEYPPGIKIEPPIQ